MLPPAAGTAAPQTSLASSRTEERVGGMIWRALGMNALVFVLILTGYLLSFSFDMNDALDTARWMEGGNVLRLAEFRHLVQRMLPLYLWQGLQSWNIHLSAMALLNLLDFVSAALSVMLLYRVLLDLIESRWLAFTASFAYATAHCIWIYTGSGRLYSTSMLLVFAGYYLALQLPNADRGAWRLVAGSGAMMCFASLFWLVHIFNAVGAGLMILLLPRRHSWAQRVGYFTLYSLAGILLTILISVSTLRYANIPLTRDAVRTWMEGTGTQPMKFNWQSPMNAAYGQANGILVMYELPYMINAVIRHDPRLTRMASFPWQAAKFGLVWVLLLSVYVYPLWIWRQARRWLKSVIFALYVPLAINMWFGLGWLGSDVQRFMPTMLSQFALAAISIQYLLSRVPRPRVVAGILVACIGFIAANNFLESLLPSQRRYIVLERELSGLRPYLRENDLFVTFGRDFTISSAAMSVYYGGVHYLNLTNDITRWHWDSTAWNTSFDEVIRSTWAEGGRVYIMDRLAHGLNPPVAAWNEEQHPKPTLGDFGRFLTEGYCVVPAFVIESSEYFAVVPKQPRCPRTVSAQPTERAGRVQF
jgi:hypothetical protein